MFVAKSNCINQILRVSDNVLRHVDKYRQINESDYESGGQLFGNITELEIFITDVSGPYRRDERGRYYYRSDQKAAQNSINKKSKSGLLYLGEWHTHAEKSPSISYADEETMKKLILNSELNVSHLILLIIGTSRSLTGYKFAAFSASEYVNFDINKKV